MSNEKQLLPQDEAKHEHRESKLSSSREYDDSEKLGGTLGDK